MNRNFVEVMFERRRLTRTEGMTAEEARKAQKEAQKAHVLVVLHGTEEIIVHEVDKVARALKDDDMTLQGGKTTEGQHVLSRYGNHLYFRVDRVKEEVSIRSDRIADNFLETYHVYQQDVLARKSNATDPVDIRDEISATAWGFLK